MQKLLNRSGYGKLYDLPWCEIWFSFHLSSDTQSKDMRILSFHYTGSASWQRGVAQCSANTVTLNMERKML